MRFSLLICLSLLFVYTDAYKIFVYNPRATRSHVMHVNKVVDILSAAGHDVVVYMPETEKGFGSAYRPKAPARVIERASKVPGNYSIHEASDGTWTESSSMYTMLGKMGDFMNHMAASCDDQLGDERVMSQLRAEHFDLGIGEIFDCCYFGVLQKAGVPKYISMTPGPMMGFFAELLGIPPMLGLSPDHFFYDTPPLSFWKRVGAQLNDWIFGPLMMRLMFHPAFKTLEKHGLKSDISELINNSSFIFANGEDLMEYPQLKTEKIVEISGMGMKRHGRPSTSVDHNNDKHPKNHEKHHKEPKHHQKAEKIHKEEISHLDPKLESLLQKAQTGTVYISFGSVAKSVRMTPEIKTAFLETIKRFPDIQFFWKYENPEDGHGKGIPNLHVEKWFPQAQLLGHPRLLAFVTHAGQNSVTEATFAGTPLICIALFADQPRNAWLAESRGIGLRVQKDNITVDSLSEAIRRIAYGVEIRENAQKLSRMIAAKPMSADDRVLRYVEFAAEFDGIAERFDLGGQRLNYFAYYNLDAQAFIFTVLAVIIYVLYRIGKLIYGKCRATATEHLKDE